VLACALVTTFSSGARADDEAHVRARAAYERGLAAHAAGNAASAARSFAEADALVPSDEAIEAALDEATAADDAPFAMTLVTRADARELDARAKKAKEKARTAFAARVGRLDLTAACGSAKRCSVRVDEGEEVDARGPVFVSVGAHRVTVRRDALDESRSRSIDVKPLEVVRVTLEGEPTRAPSPTGTTTPRQGEGQVRPGRVVVVVGAGLTLALAVASTVSTVDLFAKRSAFSDGACGLDANPQATPRGDCTNLAERGSSAETRTAFFLAGTALVGAATLATELFFVPKRPDVRVGLGPAGGDIRLIFPLR
jgi:hypothetical protein